jgi:hypothetical protein
VVKDYIAMTAAAQHKLQKCSGGTNRAIRRICVISVELSELPAVTKCWFSGISRAICRSFQREICKICTICESFALSTAIDQPYP